MNPANLQLEGLVMAMAAVNRLLVRKGLLARDEIDFALRQAEASVNSEDKSQELSPANRDAVAFPLRLLRLANSADPDDEFPSFTGLAKQVGETKEPYNDQR
jgi:hypothetical protein